MDKNVLLGQIGEKIVRNWLTIKGNKIIDSIDPYDNKKDFYCNDETVEVKTQVRWVYSGSHTFLPYQFEKLKSVDKVYYLSVKTSMKPHEYENSILDIDMKNVKINKKNTKAGRQMFSFKLDDPAVKLVYKIVDLESIEMLKRYS